MYSLLSDISQILSEPISIYLNSFNHSPLVIAFLLGLIGSVAPCQLTGNISAITLYGNRTIQMGKINGEVIAFILGKIVVYSLIGFFAWSFGQAFEVKIAEYFPIFRQSIGPLLIITGLILLSIFKLQFLNRLSFDYLKISKKGKLSSFLLGACFAIAFCPTMFVLYFVWLIPTVISTSYGFILPGVFAIATSLPLILILWIIWQFDLRKVIMKKSRTIGSMIQKTTGIFIIFIGIIDTVTYWNI